MKKLYVIEESVRDWMINNAENVYKDLLESCEKTHKKLPFEVLQIQTITGITTFRIVKEKDVINILKKCMDFFVRVEDYEKAARARDCIKLWESA